MNPRITTNSKIQDFSNNRVLTDLIKRSIIGQSEAASAQAHAHQVRAETAEDYLLAKRITSTLEIIQSIANIRNLKFIPAPHMSPNFIAHDWIVNNGGYQLFTQNHCLPLTISGNFILCIVTTKLKECDLTMNFINKIKKKLNKNFQVCISDPTAITTTLNAFESPINNEFNLTKSFERNISEICEGKTDNTAELLYQAILRHSIIMESSDIHMDYENSGYDIRIRIDGSLRKIATLGHAHGEAMARHICSIIKNDVAAYKEIKGKYANKVNMGSSNQLREFRVAGICANVSKENDVGYRFDIVIRILNNNLNIPSLDQLGYTDIQLNLIKLINRLPDGMTLLVGKTGSGKTTTLSSMINMRRSPDKSIRTAEDPIEYDMPLVNQNEIMPDKMDYKDYFKAFMRMDPDILLFGEIRDAEVLNHAYTASLSGQPFYSTLHAPTCIAAFDRIEDLANNFRGFIDNVNAVIAQKLIQKTCLHCSKEVTFQEYMEINKEDAATFGNIKEWFEPDDVIRMIQREKRCSHCLGHGVSGRELVAEVMMLNDDIKAYIVDDQRHQSETRNKAIEHGFLPMHQIAYEKIIKNKTFDPGFITEFIRPWPKKYKITQKK